MISVIIPVYNAEPTLHECVDSVLNQSFSDIEVILVDDGSKDNSGAVCDEYAQKDKRVRIIHKINGGVSSARNMALDIAQGEWITFIDSDDYITDGFFSGVVGNDLDLIIKNYRELKDKKVTDGGLFLPIGLLTDDNKIRGFLDKNLGTTILRTPWSKFYRRSLIADIRFPEDMKVGEDACFVQRYLVNVNSIDILTGGNYVVRLSELKSDEKYGMSVDYAKKSLYHLLDAYRNLDNRFEIGPHSFISFLMYFKLVSKKNWSQNIKLWYRDNEIHKLYEYVWGELTMSQKLSYKILKLISFI